MPQTSGASRFAAPSAIQSLVRVGGLSPTAAEALTELIGPTERYAAGSLVRSFNPAPRPKWLLSGWTYALRVLPGARRQIFSFGIPGDPVLSQPISAAARCTVVAITSVQCVDVPETLARAKDSDRAELWSAMNECLSMARERLYRSMMRLGRRTALERVADLLLELHDRLDQIGLVEEGGFHLPLTQDTLADALGLSVVHVNRCLRTLRLNGVVTLQFGRITQFDRQRLEELCRP